MLKLTIIFIAGLVLGAVWSAGIISMVLEHKVRKYRPARVGECRAQH